MNKPTQALFILSVAFLGFFAARSITFNVNILDLLPPNIPEVKGLNRFMEDFGFNGELFLTMESMDKDDDTLLDEAAPSLSTHLLATKLTPYAGWQPAWMENPESAAEIPAYLWFNGKPEHLLALSARLEPEALKQRLAESYEKVSTSLDPEDIGLLGYDPVGLLKPGATQDFDFEDAGLGRGDTQFVSEDGLFRVLYLDLPEDIISYSEKLTWMTDIETAVTDWQTQNPQFKSITIGYTGEPAFQAEIGGGMQRDMTGSIGLTSFLILFTFWLMHRRLAPLFWMSVMLVLILSLTILIARLIYDELTIMSVGFAAILIGLAIDYGVIILQEARQHGVRNSGVLRKMIAPSVLWAAITTAAVFYSLNFSSLPGITQLGSLVAIGILVGAVVMLAFYSRIATECPPLPPIIETSAPEKSGLKKTLITLSITLPVLSIIILAIKGPPPLYAEYDALRPKESPATDALEYMGSRLSPGSENQLPLVIFTETEAEMPAKLRRIQSELIEAKNSGALKSFALFPGMWADPDHQKANLTLLQEEILPREQALITALDEAGFAEDPAHLASGIFSAWRNLIESKHQPAWPITDTSKRLLRRIMLTGPERYTILGFIDPIPELEREAIIALIKEPDAYISGWRLLGPAVKPLVRHDILAVFVPMAIVLLVMLVLVFRKWKDALLALACLIFAALLLLAIMALTGLQWNFMNVCAFPLLLGTGIDYSIHMILALRRENGNATIINKGIGRALIFCGISTGVAFGSLATANNVGLSSLGIICAIGIGITMITAILLLPTWWRALHKK
jgi:predicted RND superfamily exporter protein